MHGIEKIISLISLIMAYMIATTLSGSFRAWVAYQFGDDTAEELGFMTLNPLVHLDFFGGILLLFWGWGWGRHVPINPHKIYGRYRHIKIALAYLSNSFAHIVMGTVSLTLLMFVFGKKVLFLAIPMVYTGTLLQSDFANAYPEASSIAISLGLIGIALLFLNVLLAVLDFIISMFRLFTLIFLQENETFNKYKDIFTIVIPMLMILFLINPLRRFVIILLFSVGEIVVNLFGGI